MIYAAITQGDISAFFVDNSKDIAMIILKCGEKLVLPLSVIQSQIQHLSENSLKAINLEDFCYDRIGLGMSNLAELGNPNLITAGEYKEGYDKIPSGIKLESF